MATSRRHVRAATKRPLSVNEICRQAENFEFNTNRSLKNWLRSAQLLITEASSCEQDGDIQNAYLYLFRHAELILAKIMLHPECNDPKFRADIARERQTVKANLVKLEQWKPLINGKYKRYVEALQRRRVEAKRVEQERLNEQQERMNEKMDGVREWLNREPSVSTEGSVYEPEEDDDGDSSEETLNANENRKLAVDLAHREIRRRDATKQSTRRAGVSPGTVAARRRGFVADEPNEDHAPEYNDNVSEGVREAGRHLHPANNRETGTTQTQRRSATSSSYQYPSVPTKEDAINWDQPSRQPGLRNTMSGPPPSRPAKETLHNRPRQQNQHAPPLPPKSYASSVSSSTITTRSPLPTTEPPKTKYHFAPNAFTEAGAPLRTVFLPPELRLNFLNIVHPNTLRNLETCGVLCAQLISNALFINHLVIPDQISTSDTCEATEDGDNALFDFCDQNELLVCGWIHTHPSQSCFLSSRDLHTASGYQVMLPEAISIVCAPKHNPDWGIFRLTDPPGLPHVLDCSQRSTFHPHSETNLYTDALKPGHVVEGEGLEFEVVDLRKK